MIFVEFPLKGVTVLQYEGSRYVTAGGHVPELPHAIKVARSQGELVAFMNTPYGIAWWNHYFPDYALGPSQVLDVGRMLEYFDLKHTATVNDLALQCETLPPMPEATIRQWRRELMAGAKILPTIEDIYSAVKWCSGEDFPITTKESQVYGYSLEDAPAINTPNLLDIRENIGIAALVAMDCPNKISVKLCRGELVFYGCQVRPGVGALAIDLPCAATIYYVGARIVNGELVDRNGKSLNRSRLSRKIFRTLGQYWAWDS